MLIEIRLKQVLEEHGLDRHGVIQEIAGSTKCHRHTVAGLYHGKAKAPSFKVLGRVCDWLLKNGVPAQCLPSALFGARPTGLWSAIAAPGTVVICLGERLRTETAAGLRPWVSRWDAAVATEMVHFLCLPTNVAGRHVVVDIRYVPARLPQSARKAAGQEFEEDVDRARKLFGYLTSRELYGSAILVGSQRANYLTELLVSDLFGCKPFAPPRGTKGVPFYLVYPSQARDVPSCFGGLEKPPGWRKGKAAPGLYYRDEKDRWVAYPAVPHKKSSGMVITRYDGRVKTIEMAVFGYSGRATAVMGELVRTEPERFWYPYATVKNQAVGVYVCRFELGGDRTTDEGAFREDSVEVVRIKRAVLEAHAA